MAKKRSSKNQGLQLSAPKQVPWVVAIIFGGLGILSQLEILPMGISAFAMMTIGFVILAVATAVKNL